jgi:phenylpyruvate tautomerase PptA (4-oxalocrotonate tautomerase family)
MPFYQCTTQAGLLTDGQKADLAREITRIHCAATGAPESFVTVSYHEVSPADLYVAGEPSSASRITGLIRAGRPESVTLELLTGISHAWATVTGRPESDIACFLQEIDARHVMEGGRVLPRPGEEQRWLAHQN